MFLVAWIPKAKPLKREYNSNIISVIDDVFKIKDKSNTIEVFVIKE